MKKGAPVLLLAVGIVLVARTQSFHVPVAAALEETTDSVADPEFFSGVDEYGFDTRLFKVVDGSVQRNETLAEILADHGVDYPTITELVERSEGVFDVRTLRAGKRYRIYMDPDSVQTPRSFVYEHNSVEYVIFELGASPNVVAETRPVKLQTRSVQGTIDHSLYQTLADAQIDATLAFDLAEVFAWQIDFFRVQPGDSFSVIFDERSVGERKVGVGHIHAAYFLHEENDYYAFHFPEEGEIAYFDEHGESLRKAFLKAPVRYSRISSRFSLRRFHPILKRRRPHFGTDYAADYGTPIRATGDGVIVEATRRRYNGRYVKIRHNATYSTAYLHMSRIREDIRPGVRVRQGDVIGYVGSTGLATGPHVCYRFWKNGKQVDPTEEAFPSARPVSEENRDLFYTVRDSFLDELAVLAGDVSAGGP